MNAITSVKGSATTIALIIAAVLIFVLFPLFSAAVEKYMIIIKTQMVKDAIDVTNIGTYTAINAYGLGKTVITLDVPEVEAVYRKLLARNLNLNTDLTPKGNSIAENTVVINSLEIYTMGFPIVCPNHKTITRPCVHAQITVPIRPSLYRQLLLDLMGKNYIDLTVHVDSDIPLNN